MLFSYTPILAAHKLCAWVEKLLVSPGCIGEHCLEGWLLQRSSATSVLGMPLEAGGIYPHVSQLLSNHISPVGLGLK